MRRNNLQFAARLRDAMQFSDEAEHVRHVLDDVKTDYLFEFVVAKRIWEGAEIVNDISMAQSIRVDTDRAGKLILTTANVENLFLRRRR